MVVHRKLSSDETVKFTEVYDSFYSLVFSSVYSRINNFHDAEDISQEVFIRLHDKIEEIEEPRKWIFGCLRNVVFDYYKRKHGRDVDIDAIFNDVSLAYVNGFRDTRVIIKKSLDEVFEECGYRDSTLFELVAMYNYTFAEAARQLNLNYKQVRYRYKIVAQKLMEKIRKNGVHSVEDLL